jgi:hAT family C-terminal dimerisation region
MEIATTSNNCIPTTEPGTSELSNGFGSLMSRVTEGRHARDKLITKDSCAELKSYIEEPLVINDQQASPEHQAEHIFEWWKANVMRYPILSRMALDYLPIQGSSVPCEHEFLDAGLTDTIHRTCLLPASFGDIQIVKNKYKKEWRYCEAEMEAKEAAQRQHWLDNAVDEVQLGVK